MWVKWMLVERHWDKYEICLLIEAYCDIDAGIISRSDAVRNISKKLRLRAKNLRLDVNLKFRNFNGVGLMLSSLVPLFSNGSSGSIKPTALFCSVYGLYVSDKTQFMKILEKAKEQCSVNFDINKISFDEYYEVMYCGSSVEEDAISNRTEYLKHRFFLYCEYTNRKNTNKYISLNEIAKGFDLLEKRLKKLGFISETIFSGIGFKEILLYRNNSEFTKILKSLFGFKKSDVFKDYINEYIKFINDMSLEKKEYYDFIDTSDNYQNSLVDDFDQVDDISECTQNLGGISNDDVRIQGSHKCYKESDNDINDCLLKAVKDRNLEYVDLRYKGGCLWIVGESEIEDLIEELRDIGGKFDIGYSQRALKYRTGWYTRDSIFDTCTDEDSKELNNNIHENKETTLFLEEVNNDIHSLQEADICVNNNNHQLKERCRFILDKYFEKNGYILGKIIQYARFDKYYYEEYKQELELESKEKLEEVLCKIGRVQGDRVYPDSGDDLVGVIDDINKEIYSTLENGASCIYIEAIFDRHKEELCRLNIFDKESMASILMQKAAGKFNQQYSYFTIGGQANDLDYDIVRVMRNYYSPQSIDDISNALWYIPKEKLTQMLSRHQGVAHVGPEMYFYAKNLPLSSEEIDKIFKLLQEQVDFYGYVTDFTFVNLLKEHYPDIFINLVEFSDYGLRKCFKCLFSEHFSFRGPVISPLGKEIDTGEVYSSFASQYEVLTYEQLKEFADEMNVNIYWDNVLQVMIRTSSDEMVPIATINFDVDAIDEVLDGMCIGDYIPLQDIAPFFSFPNIGYKWNEFILEGYLYNFSQKFKLVHSSFVSNKVCGAMVRRDSQIKDYDDLLINALANSDSLNSVKEALEYIVNSGFQYKKIYKGIDEVIRRAKLLRESFETA